MKVPVEPQKMKNNTSLIELDVEYKEFPELKAFEDLMWQYANAEEKDKQKGNAWIYKKAWKDIDLQHSDEGYYTIKLKRGDEEFVLKVLPALSGSEYDDALQMYQKSMQDYETAHKNRELEEDRLVAQASFIRSFAISDFGIYNWDREYNLAAAIKLDADFDFDEKIDTDINDITVFLVVGNNTVIKYPEQDWSKFAFVPGDNNSLVAILPGNRVATFSKNDFKKIDINKLQSSEKPSFTFKLKTDPTVLTSAEDLRKIIANI